MTFDPLAQLTGRDSEIAAFSRLVSSGQERWALLVDGLSGTGKTLLVDWLRRNACAGIPNGKLTLSKSWGELDLLASIVAQVGPSQSDRYLAAMRRLDESDRRQPLVQFSNVMEAHEGTISAASQNIDLDLGQMAGMAQLERRARRLDIFFEHLAVVRSQTWMLFLDEAEHIRQPDLSRFLLQELVPRLRSRFSGFRLYVTGQSVPHEHFAAHEREELTLGTLSRDATRELLAKTGLTEPGLARRVFDVTQGHPLLLGMLIEDLHASGDALEAEELMGVLTDLDERQRTQWIYDRVVARFEDPTARELAANLSLFEWFDLSLARAVFGPQVTEESFQEMVRRSFVKYLESGRLQCHEIIRHNLRPHRERLDPSGCRAIHQKAFLAYIVRIEAEEERIGERWFPDRIDYFTAAMNSALGYSAEEALRFTRLEIVYAIEKFVPDYLYGLVRFIASRDVSEPLKSLALRTKSFIEEVNLRQFSETSPEFLEELVDYAIATEATAKIESLLRSASRISLIGGQVERAERLAHRAIEISGSTRDYALLSDVLVRGGNPEDAQRILAEARSRLGNLPDLILAEARIYLAMQNLKAASERFAEVIATAPDDCVDARLQLASLLVQQGDAESALAQVDALLQDDPDHPEASELRAGLLISLGHISEGIAQIWKSANRLSQTINTEQWLLHLFSDPVAQRRVLTDLDHTPDEVPFVAAMALLTAIAAKGDMESLEAIMLVVERRWPETRELNQIRKAGALLQHQRFAEVETLTAPLVANATHYWPAYFIAARALGGLREHRRERQLLRQAGERFPFLRDFSDSAIAISYTREERPDLGLQWLETERTRRDLGPFAERMQAHLLAERGDLREALEICEKLIHTTDRDSWPESDLIDLRLTYARLLLDLEDRQQAQSVAEHILANFETHPRAAGAALEIFLRLQHEEALVQLLDNRSLTSAERLSLIMALAKARVDNGTSLDRLIEELARNPNRIDLVAAAEVLLGQDPELLGRASGIVEIALDALMELKSLQEEVIAKDPKFLEQTRIAVANEPNVPPYHLCLARCLFAQGFIEEGRSECTEIRRLFPSLHEISLSVEATALLEVDQVIAAQELLASYSDADPPPEALLAPLTLILEKTKDRKGEINLHRRVAASYPHLHRAALVHLIDAYDEDDLEQAQQAIAVLAEIEAEEPLSPQLLLRRARLLHRLGRSDEALALARELREAAAPVEFWGQVHGLAAEILEKLGELQDAVSSYFRAAEIEPLEPSFHLGISRVHERLGNPKIAYLALREAVALTPALLRQYEEKLRELHERSQKIGEAPAREEDATCYK